jgi:hypothetical protein
MKLHEVNIRLWHILLLLFIVIGACQSSKQPVTFNNVDSIASEKEDCTEIIQLNEKRNEDSFNIYRCGCCDTVALISWRKNRRHGVCYTWNDIGENPLKDSTIIKEFLRPSNDYPKRKTTRYYNNGRLTKEIALLYKTRFFISSYDTALFDIDTIRIKYVWHTKEVQAAYYKSINGYRVDTSWLWHKNGKLMSIGIYDNKMHRPYCIKKYLEDGKTIVDEIYYDENSNPIYRIKDGKKIE